MREHLTDKEFKQLARFIQETFGIHLDVRKKTLLETRLRKRIVHLGMNGFEEYVSYILSEQGVQAELESFINCVTTNKTDFFREGDHFSFLTESALPELLQKRTELRFWSAACSRGHEPYTLAIVLEEYRRRHPTARLNYSILATDIDTQVLGSAKRAVYPHSEIVPIPEELRRRYLLRSKDPKRDEVRIVPEIRKRVHFEHLNLMTKFHFAKPVDIIFCRNVIIYFDRETQHTLINRLLNSLSDDGYLLMGHSEVLDTREFPIEAIAPAVYRKRGVL